MKIKYMILTLAGLVLINLPARASTPEQEKSFVDSYKKALETNDTKTLAGFLYTEGAQPEQVEFFKMMMAIDPGAKVTSIELVKPSAEEAAKFNKPMQGPDGKSYKLSLIPVKQLLVKTETKDANGSSSGTSSSPVAEKNGKLVIPVPIPVK